MSIEQCRRKTFMVHQTFVWWALYISYKFVKSPIRHLGLAIGNVRRFSPTLIESIEIARQMVVMYLSHQHRPQCKHCSDISGLSVDIFCSGSRASNIGISKGPKQNLKGSCIEIHYRFSNFGWSIGPSGKISQGPHCIFRGSGPYIRAPKALYMTP